MDIPELKGYWALVTGASEGIGFEFCRQLAAAGINLVLVARHETSLSLAAADLQSCCGIDTLIMPMDLSRAEAATLLRSELKKRGISIRLLVNNAGIGRWGPFESSGLEDYQQMIALNNNAMVSLCYEFMGDLCGFPNSAVINVGSPAAYQPVPFMAVYAATKAFVHSFSQALYGEYASRGVLVQTLVPGPTATEFDEKAGAYESALTDRGSARSVVASSLKQLKSIAPMAVTASGTFKQRFFAALFPSKMVIKEVGKMFAPPQS